ncbi:hypothetical protein BCR34DRAFT_569510 [Clohesyomyces aquaticus]|uniref:Uncharacterized protein n=1 Tax=Clohesyomyces aquaticus TaxID=1231657 RepID=A0A1Y1ZEQ7_9PLEO|nr:hypothetical protein BCR34DRAFT_569510 [Clohesyomyces aquaticus]
MFHLTQASSIFTPLAHGIMLSLIPCFSRTTERHSAQTRQSGSVTGPALHDFSVAQQRGFALPVTPGSVSRNR